MKAIDENIDDRDHEIRILLRTLDEHKLKITVREGGGPEDLYASLAASIHRLINHHRAEQEFLNASISVWREIDRLTNSDAGYQGLPPETELRIREKRAWENYRRFVDRQVEGARCADCGRQYGDEHGFPDLVIPFWAWKRITPTQDDGGLLCPSCICKRLHQTGISCTGAFMSGSILSVSPHLMDALRSVENIELAITGGRDTELARALIDRVRELDSPFFEPRTSSRDEGEQLPGAVNAPPPPER